MKIRVERLCDDRLIPICLGDAIDEIGRIPAQSAFLQAKIGNLKSKMVLAHQSSPHPDPCRNFPSSSIQVYAIDSGSITKLQKKQCNVRLT